MASSACPSTAGLTGRPRKAGTASCRIQRACRIRDAPSRFPGLGARKTLGAGKSVSGPRSSSIHSSPPLEKGGSACSPHSWAKRDIRSQDGWGAASASLRRPESLKLKARSTASSESPRRASKPTKAVRSTASRVAAARSPARGSGRTSVGLSSRRTVSIRSARVSKRDISLVWGSKEPEKDGGAPPSGSMSASRV